MADSPPEFSDHCRDVVLDPLRRDPQHTVALSLQPSVTLEIADRNLSQVVDAAVNFDHQSGAMAGEIDDIGPNGGLAPKTNIKLAQVFP